MTICSVDIPAKEMEKAVEAQDEKVGICKVIPRARFILHDNDFEFSTLVCVPEDIGGKATGISAGGCKNCLIKNEKS